MSVMMHRRSLPALCALATILASPTQSAWAIGDEPAAVPKGAPGTQQTPDLQAKLLYNDGIDEVRRADNADASATAAADSSKRAHALEDARALYSAALRKFQQAVRLD